MYTGQVIEYKVNPILNIPMYWMTEITHVEELKYFIDVQRKGPYSLWHHQHHFREIKGGVEMTDIVHYKNSLGFLGNIANDLFVRNKLKQMALHRLLEGRTIDFPESFLKKWMVTQGEEKKTPEEAEKEFPAFKNQLKWTLISDKIVRENNIDVKPEEIKAFAKQQLFGYMNMPMGGDDQPWVDNYIDKMMQDRKYIEDSYNRIQSQKIFDWAETQVKPTEKEIAMEDFVKMQEEHQHQHH